jgi:hypothetical protein
MGRRPGVALTAYLRRCRSRLLAGSLAAILGLLGFLLLFEHMRNVPHNLFIFDYFENFKN